MHPTALGGLSLERADNFLPDRPYVDLNLAKNAITIFDDKYDYRFMVKRLCSISNYGCFCVPFGR